MTRCLLKFTRGRCILIWLECFFKSLALLFLSNFQKFKLKFIDRMEDRSNDEQPPALGVCQ